MTVTIESNSGCTDSAALTVLVPKMTAAGTISASNADLLLCGSVASPAVLSADVSGTVATVTGAGAAATYQWQIRNTGAATWDNITGATSSSLDISATPVSIDQNKQIRRMSYATLNGVICAGTLPIQSNSNVISIEVEPDRNPVVTVNSSFGLF